MLGWKRRADILTCFSFDVEVNKSLCKPCEATLTSKNKTKTKKPLHFIFQETELTLDLVYYNIMIFTETMT